jgi:hypothetical protein
MLKVVNVNTAVLSTIVDDENAPVKIQVKLSKQERAIATEQAQMFNDICRYTKGMFASKVRGMYLSGAGGMGKSHTVKETLRTLDPAGERRTWLRGAGLVPRFTTAKITPLSLYQTLFHFRGPGNVVVIDDADSLIKGDPVGINLLKAALDTKKQRFLSWGTSKNIGVESHFEYEGSIAIISQHSIQALEAAARSGAKKEHYEAFQTRCIAMNVNIESQRDRLVRIKHVALSGRLFHEIKPEHRPTQEQQEDILEYMEEYQQEMKQFSMRTPINLASVVGTAELYGDWREYRAMAKRVKPGFFKDFES